MPDRNDAALEFLLTRRSRPAKTLVAPAPDRAALMPILTAAARTPDHKKLEPFRFIVLEQPALARLSKLADKIGAERDMDESTFIKGRNQYDQGLLAVAVIESPKATEALPKIEQTYAAAGACLALLNAALASGWGANWLTGWTTHDRDFIEQGLGLAPEESVVGLVFMGTETSAPPERPRPDLDKVVTWISD